MKSVRLHQIGILPLPIYTLYSHSCEEIDGQYLAVFKEVDGEQPKYWSAKLLMTSMSNSAD